MEPPFDRPVQSINGLAKALDISRTTLLNEAGLGLFGEACYRSGVEYLIDTSHPDFTAWLAFYRKRQPWIQDQ